MPTKASTSTDKTTEHGPSAKTPAGESADGAARQASAAADHGSGGCRHQLVCLPGTPKPTLMLMCGGGKQQVKTSSEVGVAVIDPSVGAADTNDVGPVIVPAKPTGGAADWNWEQDPSIGLGAALSTQVITTYKPNETVYSKIEYMLK